MIVRDRDQQTKRPNIGHPRHPAHQGPEPPRPLPPRRRPHLPLHRRPPAHGEPAQPDRGGRAVRTCLAKASLAVAPPNAHLAVQVASHWQVSTSRLGDSAPFECLLAITLDAREARSL